MWRPATAKRGHAYPGALERVNITRTGLGERPHGCGSAKTAVGCLNLVNCRVGDIRNESVQFILLGESANQCGQDASGP